MEYYEFVDLMSRVPWGEQGSEEELSSAVHSLFDHEHDGLASVAEMRRLLTSVGEPLTDEELDVMVKQFSPDGDGKVTCDGNERSLTLHCIVALYARQACTRQCRNVICPAVQVQCMVLDRIRPLCACPLLLSDAAFFSSSLS